MEDKYLKVFIGFIFIVAIVSIILSILLYSKLSEGEWVCITEECSELSEGEDWVTQNCKLEGNEMICEFQLEGQNFRVPLSGVNISNMVGCKEYTCVSEVLVRK